MNKNVCMLYLGDKLSSDDQKLFFADMCKSIGYGERQATGMSSIYAQFGLFAGRPIDNEVIGPLLKKSRCSNCSSLIKKAKYAGFDIVHNACLFCSFSSEYRCARDADEMIVLRSILETGNYNIPQLLFPSTAFFSVRRMCSDSMLGSSPVIPFHERLYLFLLNNEGKKISKEDLLSSFYPGLLTSAKASFPDPVNEEEFYAAVERYISAIFRCPIQNRDHFAVALQNILTTYYYTPVSFSKPVASGKPVKNRNSSIKNEQGQTCSIVIDDTTPCEASSQANNAVITKLPDELTTEHTTESEDVLPENPLPDMQPEPHDCSWTVISLPENNAFQVPDIETITSEVTSYLDHNDEKLTHGRGRHFYVRTDNVCYLGSCISRLSKSFIGKKLTQVSLSNIQNFIRVLSRCRWIGMEKCHVYRNYGALLYLPADDSFHFYNVTLYGIHLLDEYVFNSNKMVFSAHSLDIGSFLFSFRQGRRNIHSLDVLCNLANAYEDILDTRKMLTLSAEKKQPDNTCFINFIMPQYEKIFYKSKETLCKSSAWEQYKKCIYFYRLLYKTYDLSEFSNSLCIGFDELAFMDFKFYFTWFHLLNKKGIIYQIMIQELTDASYIDTDSFSFDACTSLLELPNTFQRKLCFLGKKGQALYVFFEGCLNEASVMCEQYIDQIQYYFALRYNHIFHCSISCVVYE